MPIKCKDFYKYEIYEYMMYICKCVCVCVCVCKTEQSVFCEL